MIMRTWQPETRLWRRRDRPGDNAGTPGSRSEQTASRIHKYNTGSGRACERRALSYVLLV